MAEIIVNGATLQCDKGTKTAQILVTSQQFTYIDDNLVATEKDIQSMTNIPSFGNCRCVWYQPACVPQPLQWEGTTLEDSIDGIKELTLNSICKCGKGGIITITNSGASSLADSE